MDDLIPKKDNTPYVIFKCIRCAQYLYVKASQKTKKCLRCGRNHQVNNIMKDGKMINGNVNALNYLKKKQNELALIEIGANPDLRALNDFSVAVNLDN